MISIKQNFPIFTNHPDVIYLDSASTLQKPQVVIDAVKEYLETSNANIHRGKYDLSIRSEQTYDDARRTVSEYMGAAEEEVIFTSNSTDSVNILAWSLLRSWKISAWDNILLSELEHHANMLPWITIAEYIGAEIRWIKIWEDGVLDVDEVETLIDNKTKIIALSACSNVTGIIWSNEILKIRQLLSDTIALEKSENIPKIVVDLSQLIAHQKVDVTTFGADYAFFTGHKLGALTGIWVLRGKYDLLQDLTPGKVWGGAVDQVTKEGIRYVDSPDKFEPGTPNVVWAISLATAIDYFTKINISWLERELIEYCAKRFEALQTQWKLRVLGGCGSENRIWVFSFVPKTSTLQELEKALLEKNIACRVGAHCTHVYHDTHVWSSELQSKSCRISLRGYNNHKDVEIFFEVLEEVLDKTQKNLHKTI